MECRFFLKLLQYKSFYFVYLKFLIFNGKHFLSPANHESWNTTLRLCIPCKSFCNSSPYPTPLSSIQNSKTLHTVRTRVPLNEVNRFPIIRHLEGNYLRCGKTESFSSPNFACYDIVTVYTDVIGKSQCLLRVPNQLHVKLCL